MKILQEEEKENNDQEVMSEEKKSHIKSLLDAAKVESAASSDSNSNVLKKSDLIEMIRSSGIFSEEDSAVIEKEIIPEVVQEEEEEILEEILEEIEIIKDEEKEEVESVEEDFGVEEMIRNEEVKEELQIDSITTTTAPEVIVNVEQSFSTSSNEDLEIIVSIPCISSTNCVLYCINCIIITIFYLKASYGTIHAG